MSKGVRRCPSSRGGSPQTDWSLVSSHGSVLLYVAANPACSARDMARAMRLSCSTVQRIADDLRSANMLTVSRDESQDRYAVNLEAEAPLPALAGIRLGTILTRVGRNGAGQPARQPSA